ncbi:MAG: hypothetical protein JW860_11270 [Sedimentisphaerales bacterium]|nr:hypothetical protein [Sedimentisphaerales bacterium]
MQDENEITPGDNVPDNTLLCFENQTRILRQAIISFTVAFISLVLMLAVFFLNLLDSSGSNQMNPTIIATSGMSICMFFGIMYGIYLLSSPVRVYLDEYRITIEWLIKRKTYEWHQIHELRRDKKEVNSLWQLKKSSRDILELYDEKGKKLAELNSDLADFTILAGEIESRTSVAQGKTTYDRNAQMDRNYKKQVRNSRFFGIFGIILFVGSLTTCISEYQNHRIQKLLDTEGVTIEAKILRHYMYNITPRLEYEYTDPEGNLYTDNVMMEKEAWDKLSGQEIVTIVYLPSEPKHSRLMEGQNGISASPFSPGVSMALFAGAGVMGVLLIVMWLAKIADIKSESGKIRIIRIGDVDDSFESSSSPTSPLPTTLEETVPPAPQVSPSLPDMSQVNQPAPMKAKLPGGIRALAIGNVFFGLLGMIVNFIRMLMNIRWVIQKGGFPITMDDQVYVYELDMVLDMIVFTINMIVAVLLLISAIGLLQRKRWGRWISIGAAGGQILMTLLAVTTFIIFLQAPEDLSESNHFVFRTGMIFGVILRLLGLVYPLIVLFVLCRRSAREVFIRKDVAGYN